MEELPHQSIPLTFSVNAGSDALVACFTPSPGAPALDLAALKLALQPGGYATWHLDDIAVDQFLLACASATEPVTTPIGERRNASYQLEISDDLLSVWLTLIPAQGGKAIGVEVRDDLRDQGITHGILENELTAALASGECHRLLIARGDPPTPGQPGWFDILFDTAKLTTADIDDNAKIRYRDLSHLLLVEPNDPLMRLHPPVQGFNGRDVKGQVVFAPALPDISFDPALQGVATDTKDPHLLIASLAGQPVQVENGVTVNPVLNVKHVDLSTGKIEFDGTLHVDGDIKADMSVKVSGDVIVHGMVESAEIIAGGNVAVTGGILGRSDKTTATQSLGNAAARIRCGGSLQALFMENVHVEAGNAILVAQNARHCELIAKKEIIVSATRTGGGRPAQIIGGRAQASMLIHADILGTNVATKTRIQVGVDPFLEEEMLNLQTQIQRKVAELDQVLKLIVYFQRNPQKNVDGIANKVEAKRVLQLKEIDELTEQLKLREAQLELIAQATVKVSTRIHDGVEIQIGKQTWKVREDCNGGTFAVHGDKIVQK